MQGHKQSQMLHCPSTETSNTLVLVLLNVVGKPEITGQEKGCREPLNYLQREEPSGSTEEEAVVLREWGLRPHYELQSQLTVWEGLNLDAVAEDPILAVERSPTVDAESELVSGKSRGEWEGILSVAKQ